MGEAYDRAGAFLGRMEADSANEVLKKLQESHPQAAEFRIKTLEQQLNDKERELMRAGAAAEGMSMPRDRMLQFFSHAHLPDHLAKISRPFCQLAEDICSTLPSNPERTVALRKLLEAKDAAVRSLLSKV